MAVPNHLAIVQAVNAAYPHLLIYNTPAACGEFLQHLVKALPAGERWGLLSKSDGEGGYTFPNGVRTSYDYVSVPEGDRIDVIASAAGGDQGYVGGPSWVPAAEHEWRPNNVWVDISGWPLFDSGTPTDAGPVNHCSLAFGWFCWMTALEKWPAEAEENLAWITDHINPDVYRVMLAVEGESHGSPDVWTDAGVFIDSGWEDRYKRMLDLAGEIGVQLHCTLYGGRNQTPTEDDRRRFHDRVIAASAGRWEVIRSFECMNEYVANHWTAEEVRAAGRDMRSKLPADFLLSLSSPDMAHGGASDTTNEQMAASFDALYGGDGAGANEITIHTMRDGGKWSDPFSYNQIYPGWRKINNEPPGPGSSAGGMYTDADRVALDFSNTIAAGWPMYVGHSEWCVWNGHLPQEYYNGWREVRYLKDLPNMPECAAAMMSIASGLPPNEYTPPASDRLESTEQLAAGACLRSPNGTYVLDNQADGDLVLSVVDVGPYWSTGTMTVEAPAGNLNMQHDGNLVLYRGDGTPVWASGTVDRPGAMVQLQDDGNLVIYGTDGVPLWASGPPPAA
jgi:hypothetical protein